MNNTISENVGICNREDSCGAAGIVIQTRNCIYFIEFDTCPRVALAGWW